MPEVEDDPRKDVIFLTTAMLKAYSHPLRRRMLNLLTWRKFLRAADLASELNVPANSASFHLRVLADAGLIVEAPEHARDRRDRVWTTTKAAYNVGDPDNPIADEQLGQVLIRSLVDEHYELVRRVLAWSPEYLSGRSSEVHGAFEQRTIRLTEAEFEKLNKRVNQLLDEADESHDPESPEGRFWQIDIVVADDQI